MPASTVDEIFRFEDTLVAALVTVFNAQANLAPAFGPRLLTELPKTRLDVAALGFAKASEQQVYGQDRWWDAHYAGDVVLTVITQRGASATHNHRLGLARYLMTPKAQILTRTNLPLWEVLNIEQTGARYDFDEATDTDRTELIYRVDLGILSTAFPSP